MHDEDDFLRKLSETPADDTVRLVYADWLDERGDEESKAKARFLRLTAGPVESGRTAGRKRRWKEELQLLAAKLPTDWLAVVSRLRIDYCGAKVAKDRRGSRFRRQFKFVCDKDWGDLTATEDAGVRFCDACKEQVHYCDTITEAREHAGQGHCVAVDLGIIRRDNDLYVERRMLMGRMLPTEWAMERQREREESEVDEVSREREERKRQNAE